MKKASLSGIKKMLSRDDMKKIVGGGCMSGFCGQLFCGDVRCSVNWNCRCASIYCVTITP